MVSKKLGLSVAVLSFGLIVSNCESFAETPSGLNMQMPGILYGTAWKKERTAELVIKAVKAGFRGIDTACQPKHYTESGVGEGWSEAARELGLSRNAFYLQTKFTSIDGQDPNKIPYDVRAPLAEQVKQSVQASLTNLRTDYIDALVLHSPMRSMRDTMTVWRAMEAAKEAGYVKSHLGISNCYDLAVLVALCDESIVKPSIVQNRFYQESGFDVEIRDYCAEKGIQYQSFWTLTASRGPLASSPDIARIAKSKGITTQQAMFMFVKALGIVPLTGTTSDEHMKHDLDAIAMHESGNGLSPQDVRIMARELGVPLPRDKCETSSANRPSWLG